MNKVALFCLLLIFSAGSALWAQESVQFAPDHYQVYEEARELDYTQSVVEKVRRTRASFANERFVASGQSDYWQELGQMWQQSEKNPLWWSEQILKEEL